MSMEENEKKSMTRMDTASGCAAGFGFPREEIHREYPREERSARGISSIISQQENKNQERLMLQRATAFGGDQVVMVCADNLSFMTQLRKETVKLIITSPPYNIGKSYERRTGLDQYISEQSKVISECVRLLHPRGSICWQVGNHVQNGEVFPLDILLYPIFAKHGLKLRNRIIWHFEHGLHCSKRLSGRHESILWFTKENDYTFNLDSIRVPSKYPGKKYFKGPKIGQLSGNPLGKNPGDVWVFPNVKNNHVEKTIHPCQFPVELVERLVLSLTDQGDRVLDPYMGVGSSVVGALKNGRIGLGCDTDKNYVDVAWDRVKQLQSGALKTRPMYKPVYDPNLPNGGHR
jgi:adenine-specific DNA-methyltransferase